MRREPLVTIASVTALVTSVLVLLAAFGVDITDQQQAAISGLAAVLAPLVVALLARPRVTPVSADTTDLT